MNSARPMEQLKNILLKKKLNKYLVDILNEDPYMLALMIIIRRGYWH